MNVELNAELRKLYQDQIVVFDKLIDAHATDQQKKDRSDYLLMHVPPAYGLGKPKLMFVGRETFGWSGQNENESLSLCQRLMTRQKNFMQNQNNPSSPFWRFIRDLSARFDQSDFMSSVLWTNLSKIDVNKNCPTDALYNKTMPVFMETLSKEISIAKPDIVIFLTTSFAYDWHLKEHFGLHTGTSSRKTLLDKVLYQWLSNDLPARTFQVGHPNWLTRYKGGYQTAIDEIQRLSA